jgi:O-antigen/teichoic acid export membrane protein
MNFARGFSLAAVATGLVFVLGFVNQVLLADFLGREAYGRLALWLNTVVIGSMIFGEWLSRGSTYVVGKTDSRHESLHNSLLYAVLLGLALLPLVLLQPWLSRDVAGVLAVLVVLAVLQKAGQAIALGEDRLKLYSVVPLAFIAVYLGGNGVVYLLRLGLSEVLYSWLIAALVAAALAIVCLWPGARGWRWDAGRFKETFSVGLRGASSVTLIFLMFRSDLYLVEWFMGEAALGVYKVSTNFAEMMQRLPNVAGLVLLPKVIRGEDENTELTLKVARGTIVFSLSAAAVLLFLGEGLIAYTFPKYGDAFAPLQWMLPGLLLAGFGSVLNTKLAGRGYPPVTLVVPAVALVLNVGLNVVLIPSMGLKGAAVSTSIAYGVWALSITFFFLRYSGLKLGAFLRPTQGGGTICK